MFWLCRSLVMPFEWKPKKPSVLSLYNVVYFRTETGWNYHCWGKFLVFSHYCGTRTNLRLLEGFRFPRLGTKLQRRYLFSSCLRHVSGRAQEYLLLPHCVWGLVTVTCSVCLAQISVASVVFEIKLNQTSRAFVVSSFQVALKRGALLRNKNSRRLQPSSLKETFRN